MQAYSFWKVLIGLKDADGTLPLSPCKQNHQRGNGKCWLRIGRTAFRSFLFLPPRNDLSPTPQKHKQGRDIPYAPKDSIFGRELTQDQLRRNHYYMGVWVSQEFMTET